MNLTQQKQVTALLIAGLVASLCLLGYAFTRPQANTQVRIVPNDAVLQVDGKQKISEGTLYLSPGEHRIKATRTGFAAQEQTFTIKHGSAVEVLFALIPNAQEGYDYVSAHPGEQGEREEISGKKFEQGASTLAKNYPIVKILPHNGEGFSVNYGQSRLNPENPSRLALYITITTDEDKARALNWIRYSGYNPGDYEIIYQFEDAKD